MHPHFLVRRLLIAVAAIALLAGLVPPRAHAAAVLYVAANELGEIWQIDPVTGVQIAKFSLNPQNASTRPGLAFDGTELFYTDETLSYVQVYTTSGTPVRQLPKPPGQEPGSGLGASANSLLMVALDGVITAIDKQTGVVQSTFSINGAQQALTYAGSRNSLFVSVNDTAVVKEVSLGGTVLNTLTVPDILRGLGFSSSTNILFGTRAGLLYAVDPDTGAGLPGYPVQVKDLASHGLNKTGALASDEVLLEFCGDGNVNAPGETCDPPGSTLNNGATCRQDCTYCGDGKQDTSEQCDDGNTDNTDDCRNDCTLPRCGDGILDAGEQCDDGNLVDGDGCSSTCQKEPFCGDGIIQPGRGEQCEPPNTPGCDANCHATEICTDLTDNDGDGLIDCQDPDCDCLPIGRDPGSIRFAPAAGNDLLSVHGSLAPETQISPTTEDIKFLLSNANGKVYSLVIKGGDVKQLGRNLLRYRNRLAAKERTGLARFDLRYFPKRNNYTFVLKTYGDLSSATLADMSLEVVIGNDAFFNKSTWSKTPKGWVLVLPGEH